MKTKILSPLRRDGIKAGMTIIAVMALSTILGVLTTACSSDDDAVNTENANEKGYALPVTVNVTRQGDEATTRASYNGTTKKLSYSSGDQLFVEGGHDKVGEFAGTLEWQSGGTFKGTIFTQNPYSGTAQALLAEASYATAFLLPNGYETYGFFYISSPVTYQTKCYDNDSRAFALTKVLAVEQFCREMTINYNNGFKLSPTYAILNFTITGLAPSTDVNVELTVNGRNPRGGKVTTDGSGNATFAMGVFGGGWSDALSLTVDGTPIALNLDGDNKKGIHAGDIYNITRSFPTSSNTGNAGMEDYFVEDEQKW